MQVMLIQFNLDASFADPSSSFAKVTMHRLMRSFYLCC